MKTTYYLLQQSDGNVEIPIDASAYPVDGSGNTTEAHAAMAALDQLGYTFCARDEDD